MSAPSSELLRAALAVGRLTVFRGIVRNIVSASEDARWSHWPKPGLNRPTALTPSFNDLIHYKSKIRSHDVRLGQALYR